MQRAPSRRCLAVALAAAPAVALLAAAPPAAAGRPAAEPPPLDQVLKDATARHALVFLEFSASWCGPCRRMAREVFPRPEVQAALAPFAVARYDAERGNGVAAAGRYGVDGFPTLLVTLDDGTVLARQTGGLDAPMLLRFLRAASDPAEVEAWRDARRELAAADGGSDAARARFLRAYLTRRPGGLHAPQALDDFQLLPRAAWPADLAELLAGTRAALVRARDAGSLSNLAYTALVLGFTDEALACAKAAAALAPEDDLVLDTLAEAYFQSGAVDRAIALEREVVDRTGDARLAANLDRFESGVRGVPEDSEMPPAPLWDE